MIKANDHIPIDIRMKILEVFASVFSYRSLFNPFVGEVDLVWFSTWPEFAKRKVRFLESLLYNIRGHDEATLRTAYKNGKTGEETCAFNPWADDWAEIEEVMAEYVRDENKKIEMQRAIVAMEEEQQAAKEEPETPQKADDDDGGSADDSSSAHDRAVSDDDDYGNDDVQHGVQGLYLPLR